MKKLFKNKTTYNEKMYMDFLKFHTQIYGISYLLYTAFWSFIFILCIYISFATGNILQGIIILLVLIGFILFRIYRPNYVVHKELKSDKITDNNTNTFNFYNSHFEVQNKNGNFSFRYFMLHKIFETDKYYYLYADKQNAFIIDKNAFILGTSKDFSSFIKNKCKFRYRLKKTKA